MASITPKILAVAGLTLAVALPSMAQNLNGTLNTGFYGKSLAVQTNSTGFGDAKPISGNVGIESGGSELDALYGRLDKGALNIFLSGNLESNGNRLDLFFDTGKGGQNKLAANNANIDNLNSLAGLTLPSNFNAGFFVSLNGSAAAATPNDDTTYRLSGNYATLPAAGGGVGYSLGMAKAATNALPTLGANDQNPNNIQFTINNSNSGGVTDTAASATAAAAVLTGVELRIPYAALGGVPLSGVKVFAFIAGGDQTYLSNQSLGGLPFGTGNLGAGGGPGTVNFTTLGATSATVIPESGSAVLALLPFAGLAIVALRRRDAK